MKKRLPGKHGPLDKKAQDKGLSTSSHHDRASPAAEKPIKKSRTKGLLHAMHGRKKTVGKISGMDIG